MGPWTGWLSSGWSEKSAWYRGCELVAIGSWVGGEGAGGEDGGRGEYDRETSTFHLRMLVGCRPRSLGRKDASRVGRRPSGVDSTGIGVRTMRAGDGVRRMALAASDAVLSSSAMGTDSGELGRALTGNEDGGREPSGTWRTARGNRGRSTCRSMVGDMGEGRGGTFSSASSSAG